MHLAVFQLKQALPKSPQKRTAVLASILQTKYPTIKKLQQMNIVVSEESILEYELGISVLNKLSQDLKSTKKRNDDCNSTVQIITTSSSGENISYKRRKKSLAQRLGISKPRKLI